MSNDFKTFRELSVGGLSKDKLIQQLIFNGIQFNDFTQILFESSSFSPGGESEKVQLVKVKLSDLGLTNPCAFQTIVDKALSLGLRLCPLSLGASLRLDYLDQPEGPYLTIASKKPEQHEYYPSGFYLRNSDGSLWLRGYLATGDTEWPVENEFVFLK